MKIKRTDIYARIHKGLRKALFEFSEQAGKTNCRNSSEIAELTETAKKVFEFLEVHAEVEEKFQLPWLAALNPSYVSDDRAEHLRLERIIENLKSELSCLSDSSADEESMYQFYLHLNEFIGTYLLHMNHEETVTAEYYIDYCPFEEMNRMINTINAFTTPEQKKLALQYFMPAISHPERVEFLSEIKMKNLEVYQIMLGQIQTLLSPKDWNDLINELDNDEFEIALFPDKKLSVN